MNLPVTEHTTRTTRHTTFHLACGREDAPPIILVHGWPELSISWRHQTALLRQSRLPRDRTRHARLWTLQRLSEA